MLNLVSSDVIHESQVRYESDADLAERFKTHEWIVRHYRTYLSDESQFSRHEQFFWRIQADRELTHLDVRIAVLVWKHANYETGEDAYPTMKRIAWLANCDERSVRRSLRKLEQRGHLATILGNGKTGSEYALRINGQPITEIPDQTIQELLAIMPISPPQSKSEKSKSTTVAKKSSDVIKPQRTQESTVLRADSGVLSGRTQESSQGGLRSPLRADSGVLHNYPLPILDLSVERPAAKHNLKEELGQNTTKEIIDALNSQNEQRLTQRNLEASAENNAPSVNNSTNELTLSHNDLFNECGRAGVVRAAFDYYRQEADKAGVPVPRPHMGKRKQMLVQCIVECGGLDGWYAYVDRLMKSDLCLGKVKPKPGDRQFIISFDKAINIDWCNATLEGRYDNRKVGQEPGREVFMHNGKRVVF